jgi:Mor family transcriptional regulator
MTDIDTEPDEFSGTGAEMARIIGIERLLALCEVFGGTTIYIPKKKRIVQQARDKAIRREFDCLNYRQLASKYGLSERRIRQIIAESRSAERRKK